MRAMNRRNSIYVQLLRLLIVSEVAAVAIFVLMDLISTRLIGVYFENNNYEERHNQAYMTKLQNYIDQNHLSSRDAQELNDWVKSQKNTKTDHNLRNINIDKNLIRIISNHTDLGSSV